MGEDAGKKLSINHIDGPLFAESKLARLWQKAPVLFLKKNLNNS